MNTENLPDVLTVPEIAKHLRLSRNMVYKLIDMGQLHCYRIGTAIRVSKEQYLDYLARRAS